LNLFHTELKIKLKNKMNIKSNTEEEIKKEKEKIKKDYYSKVDFKLGYDITDFLVYIHHYIGKLYLEKPIQWYFICQKLLVKSEMFDLLKNYEIVKSEKDIKLLPDSLQFLDKVSMEIPLKLCSYETFFKKCSSLLRHYKIDTSVSAEDGRRLAYEIDFYFNEMFNDHLIDIQSYLDKIAQKEKENKQNENKSKENDDQKSFYVNMPTCIRKADWIDDIQVNPEFTDEYYSYNEWLFKEKDFDYELKLNYELIKINNLKRCILKLQDVTRSRFHEFSSQTDCDVVDKKSPLNNSEMKPQFEIKRSTSDDFDMQNDDDHDFSIYVQNKEEKDNIDVFKSKISLLEGLKEKKIDKKINISNAIAEYELFEYFQLRHLRMREFRYILLNQFNYLRSIEKRITCDMKDISSKRSNDLCDDYDTQKTFSFADFEEKLKFKRKNISQKNNNHKSCFYRYDKRKVIDEVIKLIDNKGKPFIYDIAYDDLIKRE